MSVEAEYRAIGLATEKKKRLAKKKPWRKEEVNVVANMQTKQTYTEVERRLGRCGRIYTYKQVGQP